MEKKLNEKQLAYLEKIAKMVDWAKIEAATGTKKDALMANEYFQRSLVNYSVCGPIDIKNEAYEGKAFLLPVKSDKDTLSFIVTPQIVSEKRPTVDDGFIFGDTEITSATAKKNLLEAERVTSQDGKVIVADLNNNAGVVIARKSETGTGEAFYNNYLVSKYPGKWIKYVPSPEKVEWFENWKKQNPGKELYVVACRNVRTIAKNIKEGRFFYGEPITKLQAETLRKGGVIKVELSKGEHKGDVIYGQYSVITNDIELHQGMQLRERRVISQTDTEAPAKVKTKDQEKTVEAKETKKAKAKPNRAKKDGETKLSR